MEIVSHQQKMQLDIQVLENQGNRVSFELLLKEGSGFELQRESDCQFHSLGAEACNAIFATEPVIVLHYDSYNRRSQDMRVYMRHP